MFFIVLQTDRFLRFGLKEGSPIFLLFSPVSLDTLGVTRIFGNTLPIFTSFMLSPSHRFNQIIV
jgi:hypothetical protein